MSEFAEVEYASGSLYDAGVRGPVVWWSRSDSNKAHIERSPRRTLCGQVTNNYRVPPSTVPLAALCMVCRRLAKLDEEKPEN